MGSFVVADWVAILVASLALWATERQIRQSERQKRLEVRPLLTATRERTRAGNGDRASISFVLENNGLGPAIITEYGFLIEGVVVHLKVEADLKNFREKIGIRGKSLDFTVLHPPEPMPAGTTNVLFKIYDPESSNEVDLDELFSTERVRLRISYRDLYDVLTTVTL